MQSYKIISIHKNTNFVGGSARCDLSGIDNKKHVRIVPAVVGGLMKKN